VTRPVSCPAPTFDPEPLLRRFGRDDSEVAIALGVHWRTVARWRRGRTRLNTITADRLAVRCGLHPSALWPEWFDAA
jgi:plasmid maintenance system antidote protein VapI